MIETSVSALVPSAVSGLSKSAPSVTDIQNFQALIQQEGGNPAQGALRDFVETAQTRLDQSDFTVNSKLKEFDTRDNVLSLIASIHESSMKSVSIQLTGKIGSKVSESFEQLVKQQ